MARRGSGRDRHRHRARHRRRAARDRRAQALAQPLRPRSRIGHPPLGAIRNSRPTRVLDGTRRRWRRPRSESSRATVRSVADAQASCGSKRRGSVRIARDRVLGRRKADRSSCAGNSCLCPLLSRSGKRPTEAGEPDAFSPRTVHPPSGARTDTRETRRAVPHRSSALPVRWSCTWP